MSASARLGWRAGAAVAFAVAFAVTAALAVTLTRSGPVDNASLTSDRQSGQAATAPAVAGTGRPAATGAPATRHPATRHTPRTTPAATAAASSWCPPPRHRDARPAPCRSAGRGAPPDKAP